MYKLRVNTDQMVEIPGLGTFENGEYEISNEEAAAFRVFNAVQTSEHDANGNLVTTMTPGPTVLEYLKKDDRFEVEKMGSTPPRPAETVTVQSTGKVDAEKKGGES